MNLTRALRKNNRKARWCLTSLTRVPYKVSEICLTVPYKVVLNVPHVPYKSMTYAPHVNSAQPSHSALRHEPHEPYTVSLTCLTPSASRALHHESAPHEDAEPHDR